MNAASSDSAGRGPGGSVRSRSARAALLIAMLVAMMTGSCVRRSPTASPSQDEFSAAHDGRPWDGEVQVHGALRAMFHEGRTGPVVTLDALLPNPSLYAVGALADLAGEVTVVGGQAYLSYPAGADGTRTEVTPRATVAATLLVGAEVGSWKGVVTDRVIDFEQFDEEIGKLAAAAGMSTNERFPFLVQGQVEDLQWHVIDGRRLAAGGASHGDHLGAAITERLDRTQATLVGFYSERDQGVFTHRGSKTHVHCALDRPLATGHVDHVVLPAGTTVRFPVRAVAGRR